MSENGKDKIVRLIKGTAAVRRASASRGGAPVINVTGNNNITAGGDVHVYHSPHPASIEMVQIIRDAVWQGHTARE